MSSVVLGFWPLVALTVGNLVGSGLFLFPATLAPYGSVSFIGWGLTTLGAVVWAVMFGRLSLLCDQSGGPHVYVRQAWGKSAAFLVAWTYWVTAWVSNVALVVATVSYAMYAWCDVWSTFFAQGIVLVGCTLIHWRGMGCSALLENILSLIKVICLALLPIWAVSTQPLVWPHAEPIVPMSMGCAIHQVALLSVWTYIGLETAVIPVGVKSKHVQRALMVGTLVTAVIYMMGCAAIMGVVSQADLMTSKAPYADLAQRVWGDVGRPLIAVLAVICGVGALNGWILVVGHMGYSAGKEGLFHPIFTRVNSHGVPTASLVISTLCSLLAMLVAGVQDWHNQFLFLVDASVNLILMIYAMCAVSLWRVTNRLSDRIVGCLGFLFACVVLYAAQWSMLVGCVAIVVLGFVFRYHWFLRSRTCSTPMQ